MKTELLMQMDGLRSSVGSGSNTVSQPQVFVMAASNLPWDLDVAVLRRLEKRVLVPLPSKEAREVMIREHLTGRMAPDIDVDLVRRNLLNVFNILSLLFVLFIQISTRSEGYSGADMELLCREAAMRPVRRLMTKLEELSVAGGSSGGGGNNASSGSSVSKPPRSRVRIAQITEPAVNVEALLRGDPVTQDDLLTALGNTKRSSDGNMDKYNSWQEEFGSA